MAPLNDTNARSTTEMSTEQVSQPPMMVESDDDESSFNLNDKLSAEFLSCHADDDSSMGADSVTIFEQEDFEKETWGNVVNPTSIVAVVAGVGLLAVSPLIILPIAATAVGAVQIMSHAHELLTEEYEIWKSGSDVGNGNGEERLLVSTEDAAEKEQPPEVTPEKQSADARPQDSPTSAALLQQNATLETIKSSDDDETFHTNTLSTQFPPLEDEVVTNVPFEGLNALEFFKVFMGDEAPFSFREFQAKRGDVDINYGKWTPIDSEDSALHSSKFQHLQRKISFKTLTKSYFGPPFAICTKHQQVYMNKRLLIMECKVQLEAIPFCDRFYVKERWILQAPKSVDGAKKVATLNVYSQVFFTQSCAFEQQIHSKSCSTLQEVVTSWCTMAQQALELTIQHKLERERREEKLSHVKSECSIEVAHSHVSGKFFVVGEDENEPPFPPQVVVPSSSRTPPRKPSFANLKRSVLSRISKRTNQA